MTITKDFGKTRPEMMQELNTLLGTELNWSRLKALDLQRLIEAIKKKYTLLNIPPSVIPLYINPKTEEEIKRLIKLSGKSKCT